MVEPGESPHPRFASRPASGRTRLLFLVADTGGGHRAAANAVIEALHARYPGRFAPVLCDPLTGPRAARVLRGIAALYGPAIRHARWAWGALYYGTNSRFAVWLLRSTLLALANRPVADAVTCHEPAAIVSFHPLTGTAAVKARDRGRDRAHVITVVTDLVSSHAAWYGEDADRVVVPPAGLGAARNLDASRRAAYGIPVSAAFAAGPPPPRARAALRRSLGIDEGRFLVVLSGGGEGAGGIARRARMILRRCEGVDIAVLCGRNQGLRRRLARLAARSGGRLRVTGYVDNVADWFGCADVVVTKAGPATIAEATCRGVPLLLTSHVPGQERGNAEFVVGAGAGRHVRGARRLARAIVELHRDPVARQRMRAGSTRLGRPDAASDVAALLADLVGTGCARPSMAAFTYPAAPLVAHSASEAGGLRGAG